MDCQGFRVVDIRAVRPESLIQTHIDRGQFEEALAIGKKFKLNAMFDTVVLKSKWEAMCSNGELSGDAIEACFPGVPDQELPWIAEQCATKRGGSYESERALLNYGLKRLSEASVKAGRDPLVTSSLQLWRLLLLVRSDYLETYIDICKSRKGGLGPEHYSRWVGRVIPMTQLVRTGFE